MTKTQPIHALAFCALVLFAGTVHGEKSIDQTIAAAPDTAITVECLVGTLEFIGWDRDEVNIRGTIGDDGQLEIDGGGRNIDIELGLPERGRKGRMNVSADLVIHVPKGASLEIEGVSMSAKVSDFSGRIDVETMSGNIELSGDFNEAVAGSVSGSIKISGSDTKVEAETVSGKITLEGVAGTVNASTVSGRIDVRAGNVERADLETVSGPISFKGQLSSNSRLSVETHSGNVDLELPSLDSATFDIETFSGNISNGLSSDTARKIDRYSPGRRLEFSLGSGGARVSIEAFSGNVTLKP